MSDENPLALIIFIRKPELGKVKTRLAKSVGDEKALEIYTSLLTHTRKVAEAVDCDRYLFYAGEIDHKDEWSTDNFKKFLQVEGDLGLKMQKAFEAVLSRHDSAVIIGSDCAEIVSEDIDRAFVELNNNDVVMGPALDGGYYLMGMSDLQLFLFQDMPWSEETLLEQSIFRVQDRGLHYSLLNTKSDIDYMEDWEKSKHLLVK